MVGNAEPLCGNHDSSSRESQGLVGGKITPPFANVVERVVES